MLTVVLPPKPQPKTGQMAGSAQAMGMAPLRPATAERKARDAVGAAAEDGTNSAAGSRKPSVTLDVAHTVIPAPGSGAERAVSPGAADGHSHSGGGGRDRAVVRSERERLAAGGVADIKEEQALSIITNNTPVAWNDDMYRHAVERVLKPWRYAPLLFAPFSFRRVVYCAVQRLRCAVLCCGGGGGGGGGWAVASVN